MNPKSRHTVSGRYVPSPSIIILILPIIFFKMRTFIIVTAVKSFVYSSRSREGSREGNTRHCPVYNTKIHVTVNLIHECLWCSILLFLHKFLYKMTVRFSVPLTIHKRNKNLQRQGLTKTGMNLGQITCPKRSDGLVWLHRKTNKCN